MIRVLLADDHAIFREGTRELLNRQSGIQVVAEAANGSEVLHRLRGEDVDVIVLDITMPGGDGLEILSRIRRSKPDLPVLILSVHEHRSFAVRAMRSRASGYLTKATATTKQLVAAIRTISKGGTFIDDELADIVSEALTDKHDVPEDRLTNREYEVFYRLASGRTVTDIANDLSLSVKTISTNRARILKKLHMKNNVELIRYAIERGLVN